MKVPSLAAQTKAGRKTGSVMPTTALRNEDDGRRRLAVGVVCSLAIHAGGFVLLMVGTSGLGGLAPLPVTLPSAETETNEIRPGIEQSRQVTINWLGFEDPTPHSATPAETEQAALSPAALGDPEAVEPVFEVAHAADAAETSAEIVAESPAKTPVVEPQERQTQASAGEVTSPSEEIPAAATEVGALDDAGVEAETAAAAVLAVEREVPEAASRVFRRLSRAASRAQQAFAQARAMEIARVREEARESAESAAAASGAPPLPGEPRDAIASEKESDATSRERIVEWEPGRPPAVEGLDITTVRPRWTVTTKITAVPRNPVVRMEFGKDGKVVRAAYLEKQGSGYPNVDGPLLDAIYAWTAKGEALEALAADDPDDVVSITMRIILIPGSGTMRRSRSDR
ncbi:MAG: hypothetical protein Q9O74_02575 [Planctomycetota bacterium]|nr:hypothetical protein [Planctomycetota bacterium]